MEESKDAGSKMNEIVKQTIEQRIITEWARELSPATRVTYQEGLIEFAKFIEAPDILTALNKFFSLNQGEAFEVGQRFKNWLKDRHAPSAVNLKLSTLRSITKQAQRTGRIPWILTVRNEKDEAYKDTRGPGEDGYAKLVEAAKSQESAKAARDVAILQLLFGQAFRRETVAQLNVEDLNEKGYALCHLKGYREKVERPLGPETCAAISEWLKYRGGKHGPLFVSFNTSGKATEKRLGGDGIYFVISSLGKSVGIRAWPHGLRHAGTTSALDASNGNVREVAKFTGHKDVRIVLRYDDNRKEVERDISSMISKRVEKK